MNSKNVESVQCNNFRLEIIKNSRPYITYCATPELNSDALICLAVKWVGWVGPCAGTMGWVCKLVGRVGLGWVTHVNLWSRTGGNQQHVAGASRCAAAMCGLSLCGHSSALPTV